MVIETITIQNYRSISHATVNLAPFTLLIGANGTGKSNFLHVLRDIGLDQVRGEPHINFPNAERSIRYSLTDGSYVNLGPSHCRVKGQSLYRKTFIYEIEPRRIGQPEALVSDPVVGYAGEGAVQVLDALKTGDREDLFDMIESRLKKYIPEIEKLSFIPGKDQKQLQVRERHISKPIPLSELSDGTRLVLTILTILYQENAPIVIGIEELDRSLHPRLFQQMVELLFDLTSTGKFQVIATTHNPYLVDHFINHEDAAIITEKENGQTKFTSLSEMTQKFEGEQQPLGSLWYSGLIGGVPAGQ